MSKETPRRLEERYRAIKYKKEFQISSQGKANWVREWNKRLPAGTAVILRLNGRVCRVVLDDPAELVAGVPVVRLPGIGLVRLSQVEQVEVE